MNASPMLCVFALFAALNGNADTIFQATNSTDLNDATNWTSGLPTSTDPGFTTADGTLTADLQNGNAPFTIHSNISTGTNALQIRGGADRLLIGHTTAGSLTVNSGGTLDAIGASQDVRIGYNGGTGTLTFENGSSIDTRKSIIVRDGMLSLAANITTLQNGLQTTLEIADAGTLAYEITAGFANHTFKGNTLDIVLGTTSTLQLNFAAAPTLGASFNLVDSVQSVNGSFGTINAPGLAPGQQLNVFYDDTNALHVSQVVPEPASAALLGLAGLGLVWFRRRA